MIFVLLSTDMCRFVNAVYTVLVLCVDCMLKYRRNLNILLFMYLYLKNEVM